MTIDLNPAWMIEKYNVNLCVLVANVPNILRIKFLIATKTLRLKETLRNLFGSQFH